jgi:hypothetical protein
MRVLAEGVELVSNLLLVPHRSASNYGEMQRIPRPVREAAASGPSWAVRLIYGVLTVGAASVTGLVAALVADMRIYGALTCRERDGYDPGLRAHRNF